MVIRLNENYEATLNNALLGYVGETNARPVSFEGLTVDGADRYVLTIDYGDGTVYEVDITGGQWTPTADILRSVQTVSCQIAAKKLSGDEYILVKKSRIFRLRIGAAIGDTAIPSPDVSMDALDRIDAIGTQVAADRKAAETAAQTAQSIADSLPEDYVTAVGKITENTAEIGRVKLSDKELKRRVDALFDIGQGVTHRFETDTDTAYQKTVPTGGKLMSVKSVSGRSIVWNQLISQLIEAKSASVTGAKLTDKTLQISGTSTNVVFLRIVPVQTAIIGHKYLFHSHASDTAELSNFNGFYNNESETDKRFYEYGKGTIFTNADNAIEMRLRLDADVTVNFQITPQLFDLTAMFGSGNEPTTVEEFEAMFPATYYPYNAGEIVSAGVTEVAVGETAHLIPEAIKALPGYGWSAGTARNYVDYENKRYVQCVGSVDLGTLTWMKTSSQSVGDYFYAPVSAIGFKRLGAFGITVHNILCSKYITVARNPNAFVDKTIVLDGDSIAVSQIQVKDTAYTDATAFKQAMSGVMLYYELANPIVTDISSLIPDDFLRNIEVEAGGSVTFKNSNDSYRIPVPSEEEYIVKLSEVGGTT